MFASGMTTTTASFYNGSLILCDRAVTVPQAFYTYFFFFSPEIGNDIRQVTRSVDKCSQLSLATTPGTAFKKCSLQLPQVHDIKPFTACMVYRGRKSTTTGSGLLPMLNIIFGNLLLDNVQEAGKKKKKC